MNIPFDLKSCTLFEDSSILVLNKPAGISVHSGAGEKQLTLVDLLQGVVQGGLYGNEEEDPQGQRPGVVHRLDKDTTGVMVWVKTKEAFYSIKEQLHDKMAKRQYLALVDGVLGDASLEVDTYLYRNPKNRLKYASADLAQLASLPAHARRAISIFTPLETFHDVFSLLRVELKTGRTHQIRAHCEYSGFPILGDPLYSKKRTLPKIVPRPLVSFLSKLKRQMLHAEALELIHPVTQEKMRFQAPLPEDFQTCLERLKS